jgi:hypothetical protein
MPKTTGRRQVKAQKKHPSITSEVCGLCGEAGALTKTECCDSLICDDAQEYKLFSYARNSCYRNHHRYTLCGYHHTEGHPGNWKTCAKCRDEFEPEMYVWYGTNDYNFTKLQNPPSYEPTLCTSCKSRINLGEDSYTRKPSGEYLCSSCFTI